jgi:putative endonuclease
MGLVQSIAAVFFRSAKRSSISSDPRHRLGREGERLAEKYLKKRGYKILYRNYKAPKGGEVDLVCRDKDTLVFLEVKTRTSDQFGAPAEAVTSAKQELITKGALSWLRLLNRTDILFRFDIAEVVFVNGAPQISVIKNAFQLPERYMW